MLKLVMCWIGSHNLWMARIRHDLFVYQAWSFVQKELLTFCFSRDRFVYHMLGVCKHAIWFKDSENYMSGSGRRFDGRSTVQFNIFVGIGNLARFFGFHRCGKAMELFDNCNKVQFWWVLLSCKCSTKCAILSVHIIYRSSKAVPTWVITSFTAMSYGEYRILGDCPTKYPHDICAIQVLSLWDILCGQEQKACDAHATLLVAFPQSFRIISTRTHSSNSK